MFVSRSRVMILQRPVMKILRGYVSCTHLILVAPGKVETSPRTGWPFSPPPYQLPTFAVEWLLIAEVVENAEAPSVGAPAVFALQPLSLMHAPPENAATH